MSRNPEADRSLLQSGRVDTERGMHFRSRPGRPWFIAHSFQGTSAFCCDSISGSLAVSGKGLSHFLPETSRLFSCRGDQAAAIWPGPAKTHDRSQAQRTYFVPTQANERSPLHRCEGRVWGLGKQAKATSGGRGGSRATNALLMASRRMARDGKSNLSGLLLTETAPDYGVQGSCCPCCPHIVILTMAAVARERRRFTGRRAPSAHILWMALPFPPVCLNLMELELLSFRGLPLPHGPSLKVPISQPRRLQQGHGKGHELAGAKYLLSNSEASVLPRITPRSVSDGWQIIRQCVVGLVCHQPPINEASTSRPW